MKGRGCFQNLKNFLRNCLEIFWIYLTNLFDEFFWGIFLANLFDEFIWRIFLRNFFGEIFWGTFLTFWRIFWRCVWRIFWRIFFDEFSWQFSWWIFDLLTVASFRIGVPSILLLWNVVFGMGYGICQFGFQFQYCT